ncbi:MAG: phosphomannomutase/phosphoglucomutase [Gammaproteobacteria bacterium]|nr:phosphomannomutase/phosphoglucomutase [Gammaproteobacteria bacterium]
MAGAAEALRDAAANRQRWEPVHAQPATAAPKAAEPAKPKAQPAPPPAADDDFLDIADEPQNEAPKPSGSGVVPSAEIFRAYDIRGVVGTTLNEEIAYLVGRAIGSEAAAAGESKVVVAGDGRHSSPALRGRICAGIMASGLDVIDIGAVPTPILYFATHVTETRSGVMVTGSHNPPEYNGFKVVIAGETLAGPRIMALRERIVSGHLSEGSGSLEERDLIPDYIDRIASDIALAQPLKVVADCGNGIAGKIVPSLLEALGCEVLPLYCEVDGDFPNHHPDPNDAANLEDLITVVKSEGADIGLAFDGDGDRLGVVTERGEIIWPDRLMMLFARDIVGRNPGADVIFDVKCSRHLGSLIAEYGGRPIMGPTGHSHLKAKMKETQALLGGEFSGHICFGERWYGFDDGLYSAARLLEILASEASSAGELFGEFPNPVSTPELKISSTDSAKFDVIQALAAGNAFEGGTLTTIDGIRVDYPDGWGLIRASNTSPMLTLRFEADDAKALGQIQLRFKKALKQVDSSLDFTT